MDFSNVKGVLLDFDGTIVDSEPLHFLANRQVFREMGHEIDETEYYLHWSLLGEGPAGEIHRNGLHPQNIDDLRKRSRRIFRELLDTEPVRLLPGVREIFRELPRRGYRVIIASNTPEDLVRLMLGKAGIDPCPVPVQGAAPGLKGKPHPDIFLAACRRLNLPPGRCVIVEDTIKGLRSATAAGIPCILVKYPRYPEFDAEDAVRVVNDLTEIPALLP